MSGRTETTGDKRIGLAYYFALAVLAFFICVQLVDGTFSVMRGPDSANYVLLARAIASGEGFTDINIPGGPPHTQYPPLLPLILSPIVYLAGYDFALMKLVIIAFAAASVFMAAAFFSEEGGRLPAAVAALTATNYYFIIYAREIMTEVPYLFLSLAALYYLKRCGRADHRFAPLIGAAALSGAMLTRSIGVVMPLSAALFYLAARRGRVAPSARASLRPFIAIAAGSMPFVLWATRNALSARGVASTYQSIFIQADYYSLDAGAAGWKALALRVPTNLWYYANAAPNALIAYLHLGLGLPPAVYRPLAISLFAVVLTGFVRGIRQRQGMNELYMIFYFAVLILWPIYGAGDARRYMVPLIPFLYYYAFKGAESLSALPGGLGARAGSDGRTAGAATFIVLLALNAASIKTMFWPPFFLERVSSLARRVPEYLSGGFDPVTPESMATAHFKGGMPCYERYLLDSFRLRDVLGPGDVVMARKPEVTAIITGGKTVRYPYTADADGMRGFMDHMGVTYVLADGCFMETEKYLKPFMAADRSSFEAVPDAAGGASIFRYRASGIGAPG
jgi:hypothetical protein